MDTDTLSFGRYLRARRLEKGITLETVARDTRIGMDKLVCIEQENHSGLPAEVFVKGFLRSYAKAIGADSEKAVRKYVRSIENVSRVVNSEAALEKSNAGFWHRFFLSILVMIVIVLATFFWIRPQEPQTGQTAPPEANELEKTSDHRQKPAQQPEQTVEAPAVADTVPQQPTDTTRVISKTPGRQLLAVTASEKTWLKIIIDGKMPREFTLKPGDTLQLEAKKGYNLLVGNAAGIRLSLNGLEFPIPGESGQVINLEIP